MTIMPVNPDLLVWAREHRGLGLDEAADKLGMTVTELDAFEKGKPIHLGNFNKISDAYRIPRATLLRRTRPDVPAMPRDFRSVAGRGPRIGFDTRLAIDYARTIAQNVLELVEAGFAPATPVLPAITLREDAAEAGERERERLGVPVLNQLAWRSADAFNNWRAIIEGAGCYVAFQKFALQECKGFTLYEDANTPVIMISKAEDYEPARTFTLIHEYCHLLLRQPGISDQNMDDPVERFCNQFAGGFLIPRTALRAILPQWPNHPIEWDRNDIREWAQQLKVSQQALALRLEEMGLAPEGFYGRIVAGQKRTVRPPSEGGNYVWTQAFEMGNRYLRAVLGAAERGQIKPSEAADMTHLAPKHFDTVRALIAQKFERAGVTLGGLSH